MYLHVSFQNDVFINYNAMAKLINFSMHCNDTHLNRQYGRQYDGYSTLNQIYHTMGYICTHIFTIKAFISSAVAILVTFCFHEASLG